MSFANKLSNVVRLVAWHRITSASLIQTISIHSTRMALVSAEMEEAKRRVGTFTEDPGNDVKLKMYALFKQANEGKCNIKKPSVFDFVGQAKWSAWNGLADMSKESAEKEYIALINSIAGEPPAASEPVEPAEEVSSSSENIEGLLVNIENGVCSITFNRPKKLNAFTKQMYEGITNTLNAAATDDSVKLAVMTGAGDYYSAGNDLTMFAQMPEGGPRKLAQQSKELLRKFQSAFIQFPKPLLCAVNGPAIGISVTLLGLADLAYASDNATFHTPFTALGQSPEGCSTYTFPRIMGGPKANEILLAGRKLTAQEACDRGLLTEVFPKEQFRELVQQKVELMNSFPAKSLIYSKLLTRARELETLEQVNVEECTRLEERWQSDDCREAVITFLTKKSKL